MALRRKLGTMVKMASDPRAPTPPEVERIIKPRIFKKTLADDLIANPIRVSTLSPQPQVK